MRLLKEESGERRPIQQLTNLQSKQAIAISDCIGRMIPQEGVDYDIEVTFKGGSSLSLAIVPRTDKGEWWKKYVMEMIKKYPPTPRDPEQAIQEQPDQSPSGDQESSHA